MGQQRLRVFVFTIQICVGFLVRVDELFRGRQRVYTTSLNYPSKTGIDIIAVSRSMPSSRNDVDDNSTVIDFHDYPTSSYVETAKRRKFPRKRLCLPQRVLSQVENGLAKLLYRRLVPQFLGQILQATSGAGKNKNSVFLPVFHDAELRTAPAQLGECGCGHFSRRQNHRCSRQCRRKHPQQAWPRRSRFHDSIDESGPSDRDRPRWQASR